jgi:hypothetical protein
MVRLGMKRPEVATGDPIWGTRHLNMTNWLRTGHGHDGGIQATRRRHDDQA